MKVKYEGPEEKKAQLMEIITNERQDILFDRIYQALDNSTVEFTFKFGEIESIGDRGFNMGVFNNTYKILTLSPILIERGGAQLHSTVAEELYHAYQSIVYEPKLVNIEYESQVFAYIHNVNLNCEFISEQLYAFCENMGECIHDINTKDGNSLMPNSQFSYRPCFRAIYEGGFSCFLNYFKNHPSEHYTRPFYALPNRLLNIIK